MEQWTHLARWVLGAKQQAYFHQTLKVLICIRKSVLAKVGKCSEVVQQPTL